MRRPLADRLELRFPGAFRRMTALVLRLPVRSLREALVRQALKRAESAFNRGDLEVIFATFAPDASYQPPPQLPGARPIEGRKAVLDYWRRIFSDWSDNRITNREVVEAAPGRILRRAELRHVNRETGEELRYEILQETVIVGGQIVRQENRPA